VLLREQNTCSASRAAAATPPQRPPQGAARGRFAQRGLEALLSLQPLSPIQSCPSHPQPLRARFVGPAIGLYTLKGDLLPTMM
jgi:hypothetical protein